MHSAGHGAVHPPPCWTPPPPPHPARDPQHLGHTFPAQLPSQSKQTSSRATWHGGCCRRRHPPNSPPPHSRAPGSSSAVGGGKPLSGSEQSHQLVTSQYSSSWHPTSSARSSKEKQAAASLNITGTCGSVGPCSAPRQESGWGDEPGGVLLAAPRHLPHSHPGCPTATPCFGQRYGAETAPTNRHGWAWGHLYRDRCVPTGTSWELTHPSETRWGGMAALSPGCPVGWGTQSSRPGVPPARFHQCAA